MGDVPPYSELGKNARNIFQTGYLYGKNLVKLALKTKTEKALEIGTDFTMDFDATKSTGTMESRYKTKEYGTLTERWTTDGTVMTEYSLEDKPSTGFGISTALNFRPVDSVKSLKLGLTYKNDSFNIGTTVVNAFNSNVQVLGTIVTGFKELLIGLDGGYDTASGRMTKANVGLSFNVEDVEIHLACNDLPNEYGASVFYKVNSQWAGALNGVFATDADNELQWTVGVGARCKLDEDSDIRFKFNKDLQLGTSLQKKIRDGVKITLSMHLDCSNPSQGDNKMGIALELEA